MLGSRAYQKIWMRRERGRWLDERPDMGCSRSRRWMVDGERRDTIRPDYIHLVTYGGTVLEGNGGHISNKRISNKPNQTQPCKSIVLDVLVSDPANMP
jgi:hypothetical protein